MPGNKNSGRKPKTTNRAVTEQILAEGAPGAARYMVQVANRKQPADPDTASVCRFIIEQTVGKPGQRVYLTATIGPMLEQVANPPQIKTVEDDKTGQLKAEGEVQ